MKKRKLSRETIQSVCLLLLILVALYSGLRIAESAVLYRGPGVTTETITRKTIVHQEKEYFPRQDITVMLVMGIDQYGEVTPSNSYNNHGAADMAMLMIFDETEEKVDVLQLNRDTMLEMPVLGIGGRQAGTFYGQIALSHTYGSGMEDSCENTKKTISDLLYGLRIDYYMAMNMDAIKILNDAVGGVTVNVTEDFSAVDPSIGMGEQTLLGEQALNYVRTRKDVGDQLNLSRIDRQKEYAEGFLEAFQKKREASPNFFVSAFRDAADYIVTDCTSNSIATLIENYGEYSLGSFYSPAGENILGDKYYEFYIDEEALKELALSLFYEEKE
ncbi:MAG: LCP family protein [Christensenellaceae bacterium]|nr:LCP family protein [Christensenellaceae bacterium]